MKYISIFLSVFLSVFFAFSSQAALDNNVVDKEGATVKGLVRCGDEPVANCQVSDGVEVTLTDANGHYWLNSAKACGYVFICNPDGYRNVQDGRYPQFYKFLSASAAATDVERVDFEVKRETSRDQAVVFVADPQLCTRFNDCGQFITYVAPDINSTIDQYRSQGKETMVITLGDLSFNHYYYMQNFGLPQAKQYLEQLNPDVFYHCMGNHDNHPKVVGDWAATEAYRNTFGPTYYSFNAAGVHYVILDNIEYDNSTGGESYTENITTQVMKWFRKDLKNVAKTTPVVVCMHALLYARQQCSEPDKVDAPKYRYSYGSQFNTSVQGFKDVRVFTGHAHNNHTVKMYNTTEYNVGSVSGDLWVTGYFVDKNIVCCDGSPAGYRVMEVNSGELKTYNKCIGFDRNYQFRAYDLNNCNITPQKFTPNVGDPLWTVTEMKNNGWGYDATDYNADGTPIQPNKIRVKVFAYDDNWKVEMFEEGVPLKVTRLSNYDPYQIISDFCQRMDHNWSAAGAPTKNSYFFDAQASSPTSTVTIKVTDENGNVFVEEMKRPKDFSIERYIMGGPEGQVSEVKGVFDENEVYNSPVEYYNLNGVRVENPQNGIYIRRQGNKVEKIIIR